MPQWLDNLYNARARNDQQLTQQRNAELQGMYRAYAEVIEAILADQAQGRMNSNRAAALLSSIRNSLDRVLDSVPTSLQSRLQQLSTSIANDHLAAINAAVQRAGVDITVAYSFDDVPTQALQNIMRRRGMGLSSTYRSLIGFWQDGTVQDVDRYLTTAIGRGIPIGRAKRELAAVIVNADQRINPSLSRSARSAIARVDMDQVDQPRVMQALLRNTRRIIVSEVNTTNDEAHRVSAARSPVVEYVQWELSGRHYGLHSSPDECTIYAETDLYGYGRGIYRAENKPALPHPNCACRISFVTRPPSEWNAPQPPPNPPQVQFDAERIQDRITELDGSIGSKGAASMATRINQNNRLAHQAAQSE